MYIAENPILAAEMDSAAKKPVEGTRGLYPTENGWMDIDSDGNENKLATMPDVEKISKDLGKIGDLSSLDNYRDGAYTFSYDNTYIIGFDTRVDSTPRGYLFATKQYINNGSDTRSTQFVFLGNGEMRYRMCEKDSESETWGAWSEWYTMPTNLLNGEAEGSLKTKTGKALSENAIALAKNSIAGAKAFKIVGFDDTNKTYTLDSAEGLAVGDTYSLVIQNNYDDWGTITAINDKTVTVSNYIADVTAEDVERYFRVPLKPECGTVDFGESAVSLGELCMAVAFAAFSEGYNCKSKGRYGHSEGKNTEAGFAAHAENNGNKALADASHAGGTESEIRPDSIGAFLHAFKGWISKASYGTGFGYKPVITGANGFVAGGYNNKSRGKNSFSTNESTEALKDNTVSTGKGTKANASEQRVHGRWNIEDTENKYVDIVGNGKSDTERSNAYALDWSGNGWFKGDVESVKGGKLSNKVDKVSGKGLSTNDYTTADKNKLSDIESGAQVNKIEKIKVNGAELPISDKCVSINAFKDLGTIESTDVFDDLQSTGAYKYSRSYTTEYGESVEKNGYVLTIYCHSSWDSATYYQYNFEDVGLRYRNWNTFSGWSSWVNYDNAVQSSELESRVRNIRPASATTIPTTLSANTVYDIGTQTAVSLKLPKGQLGDFIQVDFLTGSAAATVTVDATSCAISDFDLITETNTIYSLYFDWGVLGYDSTNSKYIYGWRFSDSEYTYTGGNT